MSIPPNSYAKPNKTPYNTEIEKFFVGRESKFNRAIIITLALEKDLTAYEITSNLEKSFIQKINYSTIYRRIRNLRDKAYWWIIKSGEKPSKKTEKSILDMYALSITGSLAFLSLKPETYQLEKLIENYPLYFPCWFVKRLISKGADKSLVFNYIFEGLTDGIRERTFSLNVSYDFMFIGVMYSLQFKKRELVKKGFNVKSLSLSTEDLYQFGIDTESLSEKIDGWDKVIDLFTKKRIHHEDIDSFRFKY